MSASPDGIIPRTPPSPDHVDYPGEGLAEEEVPAAPFALVTTWIDAARARQAGRGDVPEPLSIAVATVDSHGRPDVRTVLMRFLDPTGPGFVTNLDSTKSRQLQTAPVLAATLTWPSMFRAIRFRGRAEQVGESEIDAYFAERPRGSQLSAWVSHQSAPIEGRESLERAWAEVEARFEGQEVPRPQFWGGWRIVCDELEAWAGRSNRLHDRFRWTRVGDGGLDDASAWRVERLQP
ncbi:pyridoxamine 5'-phosphate oxidase [Janibacter cremeus]|uniref:Pyridoxine/pyridoxamine 5'-phosphate oxidase n=1 Tax=Janibacter cremeus TaxID=1285192 RepID=A0A852VWC7_9MICO|nr:pyridoxamine 5'-phosphate oxidase [Janibacter cremeus]NYF97831.1 pyridoxamine 5'-phosphate oxidase [Janibacter cremeus]